MSSDESLLYEDFELTTTGTKVKSLFDKVMTKVSSEIGSSLGFVRDGDFSKWETPVAKAASALARNCDIVAGLVETRVSTASD